MKKARLVSKRHILLLLLCVVALAPAFAQQKVGQKVTVTLWHGLTAGDGVFFEKMMQEYCSQQNPNIKLESTAIPWSDFYAKVKTAYLSKSLPTMLLMWAHTVPIYAGNAAKPIDDLVKPLNLEQRMEPAFYKITKWEGKTYYLPITLVTTFSYFWKQDLIDLGFSPMNPPATVGEMKAFGLKATRTVGGNKVWGVQTGWGYGDFWNNLMYSYGGKLFSDDNKKAAFNSPAGLSALKVYLDWWYDSKISPREEVGSFDDQIKRMINHGTSSWITGTSVIGNIESMGREKLAYQHFPSADGGKTYATAYYHGFVFPRMGNTGTNNQNLAAMELVNWMLDPENNAKFSADSGQMPGVTAAYQTQTWLRDGAWLKNNSLSVVNPMPYISHKNRDKIDEVLYKWFNKVRDKEITPEVGLASAEKDVNAILAGTR